MQHLSGFFDFNTGFFRLKEVVWIERENILGKPPLVVGLRSGKRFEHPDWNGSAAKLERLLMEALSATAG